MKLGICDYGIGGLGVYKNIRENSAIDILYFSDSGYIPYGKLNVSELKNRLEHVFLYMKANGVTHIAVACNAASSVLLNKTDMLTTNIIDHAVRMITKLGLQEIGIVGGARTIKSNCYGKRLKNIKTHQRIAQRLSLRIEKGELNSKELMKDVATIFEPLKDLDFILLGCTHYPVIDQLINRSCPSATLLDPSSDMANWVLHNWDTHIGNSKTEWHTTGKIDQMKMAAKKAFNIEIKEVEKAILS